MAKIPKNNLKSQLKTVLGLLIILIGVIFGPLPIIPGWGLIILGAAIYVSAKPDGWRFPDYIDKRIPKKFRKLLYTDLRTGKPDPAAYKDPKSKSK